VNIEQYRATRNDGLSYRDLPYRSEDRAYVGRQDDEAGFSNTFRMAYAFDLSQIPAGLQVISVKLVMSVTLTSNQPSGLLYDFDIKALNASSFTQSPGALWNAINNASTLAGPASAIPRNPASWVDYQFGDYSSSHQFSENIEAHFGGLYYMALQSVYEGADTVDNIVHVIDVKRSPNRLPSSSLYLEIT
jgi:hypothetical protein